MKGEVFKGRPPVKEVQQAIPDIIAGRFNGYFSSIGIPFGLVMLGSSVYGTPEKKRNLSDVDFVVVLDSWKDLKSVYANADSLHESGFEVPNLYPEDMSTLSENPDLLLRMSGTFSDFGLKTTLNFATKTQLNRIAQPLPYYPRKIAHGKAVPMKLRHSLTGEDVTVERVTRDISDRYDPQYGIRHYIQGDRNFYVTTDGNIVPGMATDQLLTGRIVHDLEGDYVAKTQERLRRQLIRSTYHQMVLQAAQLGQDPAGIQEQFLWRSK